MFDPHVSRYMSAPVRTIRDDAPLGDAHRVLREHTLSSLAVIDASKRLVGVISRTDLLRVGRVEEGTHRGHLLLALPEKPVREVMTRGVVTVRPDSLASAAAEELVRRHIHRVYVTDGDALVGVFSTRDAMGVVRERRVAAPLSDFMSTPVLTVQTIDTVATATDQLREAQVAGLVVLEGEAPVGIFTQVEALQCRDDADSTPVEDRMSYAILCLPLRTSMGRAAANAAATRARRVIAVDARKVWGVLTGIDFARALVTP